MKETNKRFGVILFIEDDDIVMEVGCAMIEKLGYTVLEAQTGKDAVNLAENHDGPIDLAMLDMDLPDMKGDEIFPYLIAARPDIKVVVCSGEHYDSGARQLIEKGAHDFLQKPFALKSLKDVLVKSLDRRSTPRIQATEDFLAVSEKKGVYSIRIIDISEGGFSFACDDSRTDEEAMVDVAILMAEKGVDLDDLEYKIVSEKKMDPEELGLDTPMKRKSVSFGQMSRSQFEKLSELINTCSRKK